MSEQTQTLPTPVPSPGVPVTPSSQPAVTPQAPSDSTPITLQIDGQPVTKPFGEWKSETMQGAAATKRFQEASKLRQETEALRTELAERERIVKEFLQDPAQVEEYLSMMKRRTVAPPSQVDPEKPLTMREAAELVQAMRTEQIDTLKQFSQYQTLESQKAMIAQTANQAIKGILETHPQLKSVPKVDMLIKQIAADQEHHSIEEMVAGLQTAAKQLLGIVAARQEQETQVTQERKDALVRGGIEPPGGLGVMPSPTSYINKQTRDVDWKRVNVDAKAWLDGRLAEGR